MEEIEISERDQEPRRSRLFRRDMVGVGGSIPLAPTTIFEEEAEPI